MHKMSTGATHPSGKKFSSFKSFRKFPQVSARAVLRNAESLFVWSAVYGGLGAKDRVSQLNLSKCSMLWKPRSKPIGVFQKDDMCWKLDPQSRRGDDWPTTGPPPVGVLSHEPKLCCTDSCGYIILMVPWCNVLVRCVSPWCWCCFFSYSYNMVAPGVEFRDIV